MKATFWGALVGAVLAVGPAGAQTYRYVSRPADAPSFDPEAGAVTIVSEGGGYWYRSVAERPGGSVRVLEVRVGPEGGLRSAVETEDGRRSSLTVEGTRVVLRRGESRDGKGVEIPPGRLPCADESVVLAAAAAAARGERREILLVDFAGRAIEAALVPGPEERMDTPAGSFSCRRVDLVLRVWIFRPVIRLWVVPTPSPGFLVRQEGKRSALGPVYITVLSGIDP